MPALAITDHGIYNYANPLPQAGLTIIPGFEFNTAIEVSGGFRIYHIVCLGRKCEKNKFVQDEIIDTHRVKSQEEVQMFIDKFHESGHLTIYCHPEWSSTPTRFFDRLQGNFAMEVWNTECATNHNMDKDASYWDEMLGLGHKIFGVAVDDGHAVSDHCGGWVMVSAENNIDSILDALKNGRFYSSCGPEIKDFYFDDESSTAHIECDPCVSVEILSDCHPTELIRAKNELLTNVSVECYDYNFIRASIVDAQGRRAWTNPIFINNK